MAKQWTKQEAVSYIRTHSKGVKGLKYWSARDFLKIPADISDETVEALLKKASVEQQKGRQTNAYFCYRRLTS